MKKFLPVLAISFILTFTCNQLNAQWTYDSVSFEMPTNKIVIDTANDNLWQIGMPQKTFFSSSHSGTKAILTDTINYYPPDDTSSFIYIIRNPYTQTCYTAMEFWHIYDMDLVADKGIIDASYDGGNSWVLVDDTSDVSGGWGDYFWWEQDYHEINGNYTDHKLITSGKSDGWIKSTFCWQWWMPVYTEDTIILNPDSLMVRFTFISDTVIKNKEGWMIDDIVTSSAGWEICSRINENSRGETVSVYPNPFSAQTTLQTGNPLEHADLTIYNSFGQTVKHMTDISGEEVTLFRDNLPCGLYFLLLKEDNRTFMIAKLLITD
jgi:hypothetical protein